MEVSRVRKLSGQLTRFEDAAFGDDGGDIASELALVLAYDPQL